MSRDFLGGGWLLSRAGRRGLSPPRARYSARETRSDQHICPDSPLFELASRGLNTAGAMCEPFPQATCAEQEPHAQQDPHTRSVGARYSLWWALSAHQFWVYNGPPPNFPYIKGAGQRLSVTGMTGCKFAGHERDPISRESNLQPVPTGH